MQGVLLVEADVDEILKFLKAGPVPSCGAVYYFVQGGFSFGSVDETLKCDM